jgi:hypothetical protein
MQGNRQFDDAKAGAEVTAGDRYRVDCFPPQFVGKLPQLAFFELAQIAGGIDEIKQRRFRLNGHANAPYYLDY